jgi:hypothetical protein
MKKLSLILAGALLLGGISFASPVVKQAQKAPVKTEKKTVTTEKKTVKTEKKTVKPANKASKKAAK